MQLDVYDLVVTELAQQLNRRLSTVLLPSWHVDVIHKEDQFLAGRGAILGLALLVQLALHVQLHTSICHGLYKYASQTRLLMLAVLVGDDGACLNATWDMSVSVLKLTLSAKCCMYIPCILLL